MREGQSEEGEVVSSTLPRPTKKGSICLMSQEKLFITVTTVTGRRFLIATIDVGGADQNG